MNKLFEGIDINPRSRTISYNQNHEDNLVTGNYKFVPKPLRWKYKGFNVISLFERKQSSSVENDASPIIYALKKEKNWTFKSHSDLKNLFRRFVYIVKELQDTYDTVCVVPSSNDLNNIAMSYIARSANAKNKISKYMYKLDKDTVWEDCIDWDMIEDDFNNIDYIEKHLTQCFKQMPGDTFRFHDIKPVSFRKYIKNVFYIPNAEAIENAKYFNGKKVLLIDDTIASGKSIMDCCHTILDTFDTKSLTILTLFSKL